MFGLAWPLRQREAPCPSLCGARAEEERDADEHEDPNVGH